MTDLDPTSRPNTLLPRNIFGPIELRCRLTTERHRAIVAAVQTGMSMERAGGLVNISPATISGWISRGRNADHAARTAGHTPDDDPDVADGVPDVDRAFWRLWYDVETARAQAVQDALLTIRQAARGWDVVETTETVKQVPVSTADDGRVVYADEVTTVTKRGTARHWQAAAWFLERTLPDEFGRRTRTELTGAHGGPVEVAPVDARAEAARIIAETADRLGLPQTLPNDPTEPSPATEDVDDADG